MLVGPHSLCDENARKSQPSACTSIGRWGAAWAASTTMIAPCSWAHATSFSTGLTVPSELETRFAATTRTLPSAASESSATEVELSLLVERDHREARARALGDVLPRHEVRVVLELGDDDEVSRAEVHEPPGVGDEVQALGRIPREDDLLRRRRVDEAGHGLARALVGGGCPLGELVDTAVHVRVGRLVELPQRVEHLCRLLRRRGRVEVGERLPVDLLLEDGEVGAKLARVELGLSRHSHLSIVLADDRPARRAGVLTRRPDFQRGADPVRARPQAPAPPRRSRWLLRRSSSSTTEAATAATT